MAVAGTKKNNIEKFSIPILFLPGLKLHRLEVVTKRTKSSSGPYDFFVYAIDESFCVVLRKIDLHQVAYQKYIINKKLEDTSEEIVLKRKDEILEEPLDIGNSAFVTKNGFYRREAMMMHSALPNNLAAFIFMHNNFLYRTPVKIFKANFVDPVFYIKKPIPSYGLPVYSYLENPFYCTNGIFLKGMQYKDTAFILNSTNVAAGQTLQHLQLLLKHIIIDSHDTFSDLEHFYMKYVDTELPTWVKAPNEYFVFSEIRQEGSISFSYFIHNIVLAVLYIGFNCISKLNKLIDFFNEFVERLYSTNDTKGMDFPTFRKLILKVIGALNVVYKHYAVPLIVTDRFIFLCNSLRRKFEFGARGVVLDYDLNVVPFSKDFYKYVNRVFYGRKVVNAFTDGLVFASDGPRL